MAVPRKTPLSEEESAICRRLLAFRRSTGFSRTAFAREAKLDPLALVRVEHLRAPLRYSIYSAIHEQFGINPFWLRHNKGEPKTPRKYDDREFRWQLRPADLFSQVYDEFWGATDLILRFESRRAAEAVLTDMQKLTEAARAGSLVGIPEETVRSLISAAADLQKEFGGFLEAVENVQARRSGKKSHLTETASGLISPTMKLCLQLPGLIERLKKATVKSGKKTELAAVLSKALGYEVELASVSRWIAGSREPGGEVALLLDRWAKEQGY